MLNNNRQCARYRCDIGEGGVKRTNGVKWHSPLIFLIKFFNRADTTKFSEAAVSAVSGNSSKTSSSKKRSMKKAKVSRSSMQQKDTVDESDNNVDAECENDGWIQCSKCMRWAHEACSGGEVTRATQRSRTKRSLKRSSLTKRSRVSNLIHRIFLPGCSKNVLRENITAAPAGLCKLFRRIFTSQKRPDVLRKRFYTFIFVGNYGKTQDQMQRERKRDLTKSATILHKLGLIYNEKVLDFYWKFNFALAVLRLVGRWRSSSLIHNALPCLLTSMRYALIRSAALMNAAIVRKPSNVVKIRKDLDKLYRLGLKLARAKSTDNEVNRIVKSVSEKLRILRTQTDQNLKELQPMPENVSEEEAFKRQKHKIKVVKHLQVLITNYYTEIMKWVSSQCVEIMGKPPCRYAVVGMGSLARKEITPYSDFEHMILLEDKILEKVNSNSDEIRHVLEYFRWFSVIFYLVILGLGETPVYNVRISSLNNNKLKKYCWFYDDYTPSGISFDSMALYASHFPLGRQEKTQNKPWTTELIKPVKLMVEYLDTDVDLKDGYHLANVLSNTCYVSGDRSIYENFVKLSRNKMAAWSKTGNEIFKKQLEEDFRNFDILESISYTMSTIRPTFNIKQLLFRSSTLFISALGRIKLTHIDENSPFEVIERLVNCKVLTHEAGHELAYAASISCEVRLRLYSQNKCQDDSLNNLFDRLRKPTPDRSEILKTMGEETFVDYVVIVCRLQEMIQTETWKYELMKDSSDVRLLAADALNLRHKVLRLSESMLNSSKRDDLSMNAEITYCRQLIYFNRYEEALRCAEEAFLAADDSEAKLKLAATALECSNFFGRRNDDIFLYLRNHLKRVKESVISDPECYQMTSYAILTADYLTKVVNENRQALDIYLATLNLLSRILLLATGVSETDKECMRVKSLLLEARCYFGIGEIYLDDQKYNLAIENHKKSLERLENCKYPNKLMLSLSYLALTNAYTVKRDFDAAIENAEKYLHILEESGEDASGIEKVKQNIFMLEMLRLA
ncbi:unnamed protein product [Clavelina lepadiformis]|uniref:Protein-PII uridylyltransferase N-terminal domain-containing protein n=1 Tax=Clavelina lepadiformis TaxID=159417 RepID=A0ABP0FTX5_CLALP